MAELAGKILISGSTGLIGSALVPALRARGCSVISLTRKGASGPGQIRWNPEQPDPDYAVPEVDAVIHLAGEPIASRWTEEKKKRIHESRVISTTNLARALARAERRPKVFVCSSAVGYYGDRGDEVLTEESPAGSGFLPEVCREWEAAADAAKQAGIRTVHLRTGLVLSPNGGALKPMLLPFKLGLGGRIGNGQQWWSWIALEDMVGTVLHALQSGSLAGAANAVAPNPVTNQEFTRTLAGVLGRPAILPVPAFAVKLAMGEMGTNLLLSSQRVLPKALEDSGYRFKNVELRETLERIVKK
jgi:uncharacterized protein (TIGR01777 family)